MKLQSKLLFGGDWYEWKEQNYPYVPYEMFMMNSELI